MELITTCLLHLIALFSAPQMPSTANEVKPPFYQCIDDQAMNAPSGVGYEAYQKGAKWETVCTPRELTLAINVAYPRGQQYEERSLPNTKIALFLQTKKHVSDLLEEELFPKKFSSEDRKKLCYAATSLGSVAACFACTGVHISPCWAFLGVSGFGLSTTLCCMPEIGPAPADLVEYLSKKGQKAICTTIDDFGKLKKMLKEHVRKQSTLMVPIRKSLFLTNACLAHWTSDYVMVLGVVCGDDDQLTHVAILVEKEVISLPIKSFQELMICEHGCKDHKFCSTIVHFSGVHRLI